MRLDLTVNIPTMISIAALIATTAAAGVGLYMNLDKRQMATDFAVATLQQRIEKNEIALTTLKNEQTAQTQVLRAEIRSDISEIKALLNQVIFSRQGQPQLKEWRK